MAWIDALEISGDEIILEMTSFRYKELKFFERVIVMIKLSEGTSA